MAYSGTKQKIPKRGPCLNFTLNIINVNSQIETKYWEKFVKSAGTAPTTKLFQVNNKSEEECVVKLLLASNKIVVTSITRIQNPHCMASYLLKKQELLKIYGNKSVFSNLAINEAKITNACIYDFLYSTNMQFATKVGNVLEERIQREEYGSILVCYVIRYYINNISILCDSTICPAYIVYFNSKIELTNSFVNLNDYNEFCKAIALLSKKLNKVAINSNRNGIAKLQIQEKKVHNKIRNDKHLDLIEINNNITLGVINIKHQQETLHWKVMKDNINYPGELYNLVDLKSSEAEMIKTYVNCDKQIRIIKITRIENPYLMTQYLLKKEELIKEYGEAAVQSLMLLHGTKEKNIDSIAKNNFDVRRNKRHLYGKGVYFTRNVGYAQNFSDYFKKVIVIVNVLVSKTCQGNLNMEVPLSGFDTSISVHKRRNDVIVKYDDNTFYPSYIVHLKMPVIKKILVNNS